MIPQTIGYTIVISVSQRNTSINDDIYIHMIKLVSTGHPRMATYSQLKEQTHYLKSNKLLKENRQENKSLVSNISKSVYYT